MPSQWDTSFTAVRLATFGAAGTDHVAAAAKAAAAKAAAAKAVKAAKAAALFFARHLIQTAPFVSVPVPRFGSLVSRQSAEVP